MAIQFDPNSLSRFANVDFGNDDAIANLGDNGSLVQKKELGSAFLRIFRLPSTKNRNNAVRTELLKALGQAFDIDGVSEQGGKTKFSAGFMRRLEEILGPEAFKRDDFGLKGGEVASGKPLTQRRILAVCNAATDYAARARINKKFEEVVSLLKGGSIAELVGDNRDEGWSAKLDSLAELAANIQNATLRLKDDGDTATIFHGNIKIVLECANGGITANLTCDGVTRTVNDLRTSDDALRMKMSSAIDALYDSFTETKHGGLTYGRAAISTYVFGVYMDSTPPNDMDTKKKCPLRDFASRLLKTKAGISDAEIAKLTNREALEVARELCRTDDVQSVKRAMASIQAFKDMSALLRGRTIAEIIGDDRDEGWSERVDNLAVVAVKIHDAVLAMKKAGDSATVEHGDLKVNLKWGNGGITARLAFGEKTCAVDDFATTKDELCVAMDDAVASLYNSFTETKDGDLTFGRAALAGKVLAYYKEQSVKECGEDYLDSQVGCPARDFAAGLLMTKARVTEAQIAKLTNRQLENFAVMLCQAGDASGIKDVVDETIAEGNNL